MGNRCAVKDPSCQCWVPRGPMGCTLHKKSTWTKLLMDSSDEEPVVATKAVVEKKKIDDDKTDSREIKRIMEEPAKPAAENKTGGDSKAAWASLMSKMKPDAPKKKPAAAGKKKQEEKKKPSWQEKQVGAFFLFDTK